MQDRVDRVALEAERVLRVVAERRRVGRELDERVQRLGAVAHPQLVARLAEAPGGEAVAGRQDQRLRVEPLDERAHARAVLRVALVVAPVALEDPLVGRAIDLVDVPPDRRQPAGDERLAQPLGREREVGHDAEAAEALAEHAPALDAELGADRLGVAHDRVGAEVLQVLGLLGGAEAGQRADRRGAAGAALVEHQHAEVLQRPLEPARRARVPGRPRRLEAGTALEEDEERPVGAAGIGDLAREHGDRLAARPVVVERERELVLGQHEPMGGVGDGRHDPQTAGGSSSA